ncbi:DUF6247 family protein [Actinomadura rupiterrae]|uniref:DUF6247 family protein n=1 Tax=Actinomadura rupiterrae TaxID=559627 RepID=UPI0020A40BCB|nr:DUF6247 family protein [Actinomadura rupiterrae]MCP2337910.1 23S rRNA A2030 N6-methylase RlmJ [Actinomadura rupiterrae]
MIILTQLPQRLREVFRQEYEAAVEAARAPEGYQSLQAFLQQWSVRAKLYADPAYWEAREAARSGEGPTYTMEEVEAMRRSA